eukprot:CAMPEP_0178974448 /NCGR_PEP_ID=MMETSP0789-20121207/22475_1 /TAXON_ID=3005 /ORGANISM="Rhizosolenia setigera, Strain CCMP 1694" /LENGTH=737 /DNA_ID=CAMNT_0020662809 /DNA_START=387 /DNA_END=2601 /DNA_ORIENTATION=+
MKASSPANNTSITDNSLMNYTAVASNRRGAPSSSNGTRNRGDVQRPPPEQAHSHGNPTAITSMSNGGIPDPSLVTRDPHGWTRGGRQFSSSREVYTRSLYRLCLKFTTSEDEDEGKAEPATAYWTLYGHQTTVGNGGPGSPQPDDICRRMDDSMSGPAAGILSRITDHDGDSAASASLRAGLTCAWQIRGDRGDAAIRVGKARVVNHNNGDGGLRKDCTVLSLDADRWELCEKASFAAGNSVFVVENNNLQKRVITLHCTRGPMRGKLIEISASRCPFVFGRAHEADLCIMDRELSRRHGAILYMAKPNGGAFVLVDLESTNGSYMRLVGPYSQRGMGSLAICDEFIVGRTGFSVNRFDYGISEAIGARPTMEDRTVVIQSLMFAPPFERKYINNVEPKEHITELAMTSFAAVFDGHGGDECSNYLVDNLPRQIRAHMLAERENLKKAIEASRNTARGGIHSEQSEDAASELMRRILKTAYLRTDKDFISPRAAPQSGSTGATVILMGRRLFAANVGDSRRLFAANVGDSRRLFAANVGDSRRLFAANVGDSRRLFAANVGDSRRLFAANVGDSRRLFAANVGDSRVVLCRGGGQCVELTSDHKPSRPDEAARVRAAGGFILHKRVMGELAITRAFGDKSFKMGIKAMLEEEAESSSGAGMGSNDIPKDLTAPLISAEPEIASMVLSHNDEFLLLACDGLFDVFRSQDAIALARQELIAHRGEPAEVARIQVIKQLE